LWLQGYTARASLLCSAGKIFHCVHYLSAAPRITLSHSMIYGYFFGQLATSTYLYDVTFIQAFNSLYNLGWRAVFIENAPQFIAIYFIKLTTGWTVRDQSRWGRDFPPVQTGPGAHPASCNTGTRSFPGVKCGQSMLLTTHPLLVPRSWKSRAITLPTLWVIPDL